MTISLRNRWLQGLTRSLQNWTFKPGGTPSAPIPPDLAQLKAILERILLQNIIPFWYPHCIDWELGGYRLNHDVQGRWQGDIPKRLVTQARTVWFFAHLSRTAYGNEQHLIAAQHGYEFLRAQFWDANHGGFFWEVDASGHLATIADKHLYGQAFALHALSEYAIASGEASALDLAGELFQLLERAYDPQYGGYQEFFQQDWQLAPSDWQGHVGFPSPLKTLNTHLHLMEAITVYYLLSKDEMAKTRLIELIIILSNTVLRKTVGGCTDPHQADWVPLNDARHNRVSYGHDLENIWLLMEACSAVGLSHHLLLDFHRTLFNDAMQYGCDRKQGGFYDSGCFHQPADRRNKVWWVQAEALVAALRMYRLTQEESYLTCFEQTLNWIDRHQVDWECGDWFYEILPNGTAMGDKASAWKSPYHNGRAMLECLKWL